MGVRLGRVNNVSAGANNEDDSSCVSLLRNKVLTAFEEKTGRMCHRLPLLAIRPKRRDAIEKAISRTSGTRLASGLLSVSRIAGLTAAQTTAENTGGKPGTVPPSYNR